MSIPLHIYLLFSCINHTTYVKMLPERGINIMSAPIPNRKTTQLRINETLYKKTKIIAVLESRNTNSQIEYFVRKGVENYEKEHGSISL